MDSTSPSRSIGGANLELLEIAGRTGVGAISDSDPVPWDQAWHKTFEHWRHTNDSPAPIMLVFCKRPGVFGNDLKCTQLFQFGAISKRPECGVYLVGRSPAGNGWLLPLTGNDHQENCQILQETKLGNSPLVVFGLNESDIIFLPNGLDAEEANVLIPTAVAGSPFNDELLTSELEHFATRNLASGDLRKKLWEKASHYWPIEQAERTIQLFLLISLRAVFKNYEILAEAPVVAGRIDVLILPGDSTEAGRVILELKAVRQFGSTGIPISAATVIAQIHDGIIQAMTYFKNATNKYICLYDMRKDKISSIYDAALLECTSCNVELRQFEVHPSAEDVRHAIVASGSGSTK